MGRTKRVDWYREYNPCKELSDRFDSAVMIKVEGWWNTETQAPKFANDLYEVIKMALSTTASTASTKHIDKCFELLRVLNEMEGR